MPTCDKFDVLVDGSVGSKRPAVCECFLEWPLLEVTDGAPLPGRVKGEAVRAGKSLFIDLAAAPVDDVWDARVGREKFCRLLELEFECFVNCAYMGGIPAAAAMAFALLRALLMLRGYVESSLDEDSTRRGGGGLGKDVVGVADMGDDVADAAVAAASPAVDVLMLLRAPGKGEKLPGALTGGLDDCIACCGCVRGLLHLGPAAGVANPGEKAMTWTTCFVCQSSNASTLLGAEESGGDHRWAAVDREGSLGKME
jgi:hypothetical protein